MSGWCLCRAIFRCRKCDALSGLVFRVRISISPQCGRNVQQHLSSDPLARRRATAHAEEQLDWSFDCVSTKIDDSDSLRGEVARTGSGRKRAGPHPTSWPTLSLRGALAALPTSPQRFVVSISPKQLPLTAASHWRQRSFLHAVANIYASSGSVRRCCGVWCSSSFALLHLAPDGALLACPEAEVEFISEEESTG